MQLSTENLSIAMVSLFWLIRRKARVRIQGQTLKRNIKKKTVLRRIPFSRFLAKTLRVNKPAMKKFLKILSFGIDVKL